MVASILKIVITRNTIVTTWSVFQNGVTYVVPGLLMPLLGRPAIQALELVKRFGPVEDKTFDTQKAFPALFQNLGKLQRSYHIQMKEGAKPLALTVLRRVPVPLLPRVKVELERMRQLGVIVPIREPTDSCSGIMVVRKPQDKAMIGVDLTQLNKGVQCMTRTPPAPICGTYISTVGWGKDFYKITCQLRILAATANT